MSDLEKPTGDELTAQALAMLRAQEILRAEQAPAQPPAPIRQVNVGQWVALGIGGALALTPLAMAAAMLAIALGISAVALTICVLVLRGMWTDAQKGRRRN
ncbi:hypothetical protein [Streptomyces sp. t39]|uniref:hypothetical protein n=1 Tax=Streptomyces sp. t39 TaxID=1828156 RepID=UPI0011CD8AE5|nr:hypothetical protein [Streptomyces sp. t39]TXS42914.1 hypothetical protein EAO77_35400 [Streptomyces sp. t39]